MLKKLLFVYGFLFAYSGAILHSIVPHHHHDSHKEAKEHHHHGTQASHSHDDNKQDNNDYEHTGSLYFLTHSVNSDIVVSHSASFAESVKGKSTDNPISAYPELPKFGFALSFQVFHPPSDDSIAEFRLYHFRALRAPPSIIA
jgi:hypothetical protein